MAKQVVTHRSGLDGFNSHALTLLPIVVAVLVLLRLLGAAGGLAGQARGTSNHVVTRLAVSLRLFVVGLALLVGLEQALLLGVDCGGGLDRGGFLGRSAFLVGVLVIPSNLILGSGSCKSKISTPDP